MWLDGISISWKIVDVNITYVGGRKKWPPCARQTEWNQRSKSDVKIPPPLPEKYIQTFIEHHMFKVRRHNTARIPVNKGGASGMCRYIWLYGVVWSVLIGGYWAPHWLQSVCSTSSDWEVLCSVELPPEHQTPPVWLSWSSGSCSRSVLWRIERRY